MTKKRVLIFSLAYYPLVGGAEIAVKEITDRLDPEEFEFHMVTMRLADTRESEKIGNVAVHRVGFSASSKRLFRFNKYLFFAAAPLAAARLHRKARFDMVWSIMAYVAGFPALFFKLFHMDVPFVLTLQEGDPIEYMLKKTKRINKIFKMIFSYADSIQTISRYLADFAKDMGAKAEPAVVPNGVDVARFAAVIPEEDLEAARREIGKLQGDAFLVTASRLVKKNGVVDIVDSLQFLPKNVKLLILGTGDLESDLKARAKERLLGDRVVFRGYVDHSELPKYLKACDIFVRPSLSEGLGNSFIEAMAAGVPVIATPVGGIYDFLYDKRTGLFCEVNSPKDIARKVGIYMNDKNLRAEIVENALSMVKEKYDWKRVAEDMRDTVFEAALLGSRA